MAIITRRVLPAVVALLLLVTSAKASGGVVKEDYSTIQYSDTSTDSSHAKVVTLPASSVNTMHDDRIGNARPPFHANFPLFLKQVFLVVKHYEC